MSGHHEGRLDVGGVDGAEQRTIESGDNLIAVCCHEGLTSRLSEMDANAVRLVSCWNACAGMPDPERGVKALIARLKARRANCTCPDQPSGAAVCDECKADAAALLAAGVRK